MSKYACGFSEHPNSGEAVGEAVGQIQQEFGGIPPHLVVTLISGQHLQDFANINKSVRTLLSPEKYIGATAGTVITRTRHIESGSGISIWATKLTADIFKFDQDYQSELERLPVSGTLIFIADPHTVAIDNYLSKSEDSENEESPLQILGGFLSTANNHIVIDDDLYAGGAVGIHFPKNAPIENIVSQGFKPVGQPFTITGAEGNKITSLGGQPPIKRLSQTFNGLDPRERAYLKSNLHIGIAMDENKLDIERGDFLIRAVTALQKSGDMNVAHLVEVGDLVQFQLLDPLSALDDLKTQLQGKSAASVLMFSCNGRGSRLFGKPDIEPSLVYTELSKNSASNVALVGMSCAGEFGPIANQNFLHGFTTTLALFS